MRKNPSNFFLREKAGELTPGGGAAVAEQPGAAASEVKGEKAEGEESEEEEEEKPEQPEAREPGRLEMVAASLKSKGKLLAQLNDANAALATAQGTIGTQAAEIERLQGELQTVTQERESARTELAAVDKLLKEAQGEAKSAEDRAIDLVAERGFSAKELPAAESEPAETVESLQAKLGKETDATKRWELCEQINALRWPTKEAAGASN